MKEERKKERMYVKGDSRKKERKKERMCIQKKPPRVREL